ncbi:hypothetical protein VE04_02109 [Pseudogymnoascus sp. 24MN13]|nr:hypothetical protein VE04_02109 [Pseudogymnoascus sp. 24MN13]
MTSDAQINKFLTKIDEKSKQLRINDMTRVDQELLKNRRLDLIWGDLIVEKADSQDAQLRTWRKSRARRVYREIQDTSDHLFLAFVLAIPPTECVKKSFDNVMEYLIRLESYEPYRLNLNPAAKSFFESTAAEKGFSRCPYYLSFMQALFPKRVYPLEDGQQPQSSNDQSPDNRLTVDAVVERPRKRKRTSADNVYPPAVTDRIGSGGPDAVIRLLEAPLKSNEDARQNTIASPAVSTSSTNTPPNEMQSGPTEQHLVLEKASLRGIAEVFDNYICDAISKVSVQNNEKPF